MNNNYALPVSIIIAGLFVGGGIYLSNKQTEPQNRRQAPQAQLTQIREINQNRDHILGNPNAPLTMVVYTDTQCPFCKSFHSTLKQVMDTYGKEGRVAVVYRHFPLTGIHPRAKAEANASECVASVGGEKAFWAFMDKVFATDQRGLQDDELIQLGVSLGIPENSLSECIRTMAFESRVAEDLQDGQNAGAQGTPHTVIVTKKGKTPFSGAVPFDTVKAQIETSLKDL